MLQIPLMTLRRRTLRFPSRERIDNLAIVIHKLIKLSLFCFDDVGKISYSFANGQYCVSDILCDGTSLRVVFCQLKSFRLSRTMKQIHVLTLGVGQEDRSHHFANHQCPSSSSPSKLLSQGTARTFAARTSNASNVAKSTGLNEVFSKN